MKILSETLILLLKKGSIWQEANTMWWEAETTFWCWFLQWLYCFKVLVCSFHKDWPVSCFYIVISKPKKSVTFAFWVQLVYNCFNANKANWISVKRKTICRLINFQGTSFLQLVSTAEIAKSLLFNLLHISENCECQPMDIWSKTSLMIKM